MSVMVQRAVFKKYEDNAHSERKKKKKKVENESENETEKITTTNQLFFVRLSLTLYFDLDITFPTMLPPTLASIPEVKEEYRDLV